MTLTAAPASKFVLRDYQVIAVQELRRATMQSGSAVYVLPTGGGKTVVAAEVARLASLKGSKTMLLVHRRELVDQAVETLSETCPDVSLGVEAAGWPSTPWAELQVGSIASVLRRPEITQPDIVIVDEAHHARAKTWEQVLKRWPAATRIGLTATPERLDGKGLGEHFAVMVLGPTVPDLVASGDLAPTRTLTVPSGLTYATPKEMREQAKGRVIAKAASAYVKYAMGKQAIFFGVHREHSKQVAAELVERGVRAAHVDGTDSTARRDRIMREFKTGGLDVVCNCDLISEGFDAPACEVVLLGAPTKSVTRYLQQAGRSMRPGEGKEALVVDLTGTSYELGLPDDVREWSLEDGEIREASKAEEKAKACLQCSSMFRGRVCPWCKYQTPMAKVRETETELVQAQRRQQPRRRSELWAEVGQAKRSADPEKDLLAIAEQRGYKPGWAYHILGAWEASRQQRLFRDSQQQS